jgi:hypothetical protein
MLYQRGSAAAYELVSMDAGDEPGPSGSSADTTITGSGGHKRPRRHSKASTRKHSKAAAGGTVGQQAYQNLQMADDEYDDNSKF